MPIAIHTRYLGATDSRGSRIKASAARRERDGSVSYAKVTVHYDYEAADPHAVAAQALRDKYFPGEPLMYAGTCLDGEGDIYTISPETVY